MPFSHSLGEVPLAEDFEPDIFGFPQREKVDCETLHLFTSKTRHACARPLQGKLLRLGSPGDCLGLPHLWINELTTVLYDSN